jgi:hypothetical protein
MLPPTALHGLSAVATTTLRDFDAAFAAQERGGVRDGNDRTTQSRADHFVRWLTSQGISRSDLVTLLGNDAQTVKLIGAFAWDIKQDLGIKSTSHPSSGTAVGYIKAASLWLQTEFGQVVQTYCLTSSGASIGLYPLLRDLIASQTAWSRLDIRSSDAIAHYL